MTQCGQAVQEPCRPRPVCQSIHLAACCWALRRTLPANFGGEIGRFCVRWIGPTQANKEDVVLSMQKVRRMRVVSNPGVPSRRGCEKDGIGLSVQFGSFAAEPRTQQQPQVPPQHPLDAPFAAV
jgi:hypothetical protein